MDPATNIFMALSLANGLIMAVAQAQSENRDLTDAEVSAILGNKAATNASFKAELERRRAQGH